MQSAGAATQRAWSLGYRAAWAAVLGLAAPYWVVRGLVRPIEMRERFGDWSPLPGDLRKPLWIHAASLGETRVLRLEIGDGPA